MRPEILLAAFAADVVTLTPKTNSILKGSTSPGAEVGQCIQAHPEWQRVVVFRMNG